MTNQSDKQLSVRAASGTSFSYEGDWHALWDIVGIPLGPFDQRMIIWINGRLGTSYSEINGAMAAFAIANGASSWDSLGIFTANAFSPSSISGLSGWYDASDAATISQSGGLVSQWNDKATPAHNMTQATGAKQPLTGTATIGGKNAIRFDGANDILNASGITAPTSVTCFAVFSNMKQFVTGTETQTIVCSAISGFTAGWGINGCPFGNAIHRITGEGMATFQLYKNGVAGTPGSDPGTAGDYPYNVPLIAVADATVISPRTVLSIGGTVDEVLFGQNDIGEIIYYNRILTSAEKNQLGAYIQTKWGIAWTNIP